MKRKGIVLGGGASGLMAAIIAKEHGADVTILEHMPRVGKKILSTGNGKCNLTNLFLSEECYRSGEKDFPMKVIRNFMPEDTIAFFRRLGVVTTDRNGYVYPNSGQAKTVLDALRFQVDSLSIPVLTETETKSVTKKGRKFLLDTTAGKQECDFLILAAGSKAAKNTGSDGSGYEIASSLGHSIVKPLPALVQLRCKGDYFKGIAGVRTDALVSVYSNDRLIAEDRGELQLTDYGISGIPVFQISRYVAKLLDQKKNVTARIDFYPGLSFEELETMLTDQKKYLKDRTAGSYLSGIFNQKLADLFMKTAGIRNDHPVNEISARQIRRLASMIHAFDIEVMAVNPFEQAQICMGGVKTGEIDPDTMESKLVRDLYFAGELVDVDGICGGYNLQWAWASGYTAGKSAAEKGR